VQKEELQRQREVLQRQIDLFDEYKCRSMRDIVSAASAAATSSPSAASATSVIHHRSASDDAAHHQYLMNDDQKYSYNTPPWSSRVSGDAGWSSRVGGADLGRTGRGSPRPAAAVCRRDTMPPIHLFSATNEVKSGPVQPQQLPLKLATSSDQAGKRPRWTSGSPSSRSPLEYLIDSPPVCEDPGQADRSTPDQQVYVISAARCEPSICEEDVARYSDPGLSKRSTILVPASIGVRSTGTSKHSGLTTSTSASSVMKHTGGTSSVMSKSSPSASTSSILPMKLAERPRPKSASSPTIQPTSPTTSSSTLSGSRTKCQTKTRGGSGTPVVPTVRSRTSPGGDVQSTRSTRRTSPPQTVIDSVTSNSNATPSPTYNDREIIYF